MRQLEYTKSDFGFEYHMVELLWVLNRALVDRKKINRDLDPDHHLKLKMYRRSRSRAFIFK